MEPVSLSLIFSPCSNWEKRSCADERKSFFTIRTVQVLEEMATAQAVLAVLGDFPDLFGNSSEQPDLSRPCLETEIGQKLSWGLFQLELFCDYLEGALYGSNGTAVSCSHHLQKTKKNKKPNQKITPKILCEKTRAWIDLYIPRTEWRAHSPSKVVLYSVASYAKWETNVEEMFAASEESLNRSFFLSPSTIPQAYPLLCMEGSFFLVWDFFFF